MKCRRRGRALRRRYGRMTQMQLPFYPAVTDVLGETRQIEKVYENGSYNCPFCGYAADLKKGCHNPACSANEYALSHPEQARPAHQKAKASHEARLAEEAERQQINEFRTNYAEEQRQERAKKEQEVIQEAHRRGACVRCALEPLPYRPPKYIKHRGVCPKERR